MSIKTVFCLCWSEQNGTSVNFNFDRVELLPLGVALANGLENWLAIGLANRLTHGLAKRLAQELFGSDGNIVF